MTATPVVLSDRTTTAVTGKLSFAVSDSWTMFRRDLLHARRYPSVTLTGFVLPVIYLLLFDEVFGHTIRAGLSSSLHGTQYIDFLVPAVLVMAAGGVAEATAIDVNADSGEGIISRFRTMPIWRPSLLVGKVSSALVRTFLTGGAVLGIAVGLGASSGASALGWLAAIGLYALLALALTWLTVAFGLYAKTPGGANSLSLIPLFLPMLSSAFVPTATMPSGLRVFAEYQPYTPIIDTLRSLLAGDRLAGDQVLPALAWCAGIALVGYLWSMSLYNRGPARAE